MKTTKETKTILTDELLQSSFNRECDSLSEVFIEWLKEIKRNLRKSTLKENK